MVKATDWAKALRLYPPSRAKRIGMFKSFAVFKMFSTIFPIPSVLTFKKVRGSSLCMSYPAETKRNSGEYSLMSFGTSFEYISSNSLSPAPALRGTL